MTIGGLTIDQPIRLAMLQAAIAVESKIGRRLETVEMDMLIVETVRQVIAKREGQRWVQ